jgi:hypothetical protein
MRATVVFPLVPVIDTVGMRDGVPGGNSRSTIADPTRRAAPPQGCACNRPVNERRRVILEHQIHSAEVEPHDAGGAFAHRRDPGMQRLGDVGGGAAGGEIARAP